ncbi:uncharacterized protein TNCV_3955781 [Trichonephila clavipes]|nr:uncharacterized protein TNCV_3955781 [Trichonephila clavipes]
MQRDLFGRLLGISMTNKVDIEKVLRFPLTSIPTSMCHTGGSICKTDKAQLIKVFEKKFKLPRIDIVFDQYFTPSIKDCERLRRNETTSTVSIGPNQIRHHNFAGELKNTQFKEALVKIFIDHWANDNMHPFIGNKTIYLSFDKCYSYHVVNNQVIRSIEESLSCDEHEADTRIIYHICQISVDAQVVVRCSDSDILIIFLGNLDHLNASLKLWIQWGVGNHERLISINDLYQDLCISLSKSLSCFQAITGCDYTPAFFRKASGWIVNDDKYDFVWFAGEQFPSLVADIVIKKPTLLENQNTKQDDDYDDIDNNGSSDNDDDYEDASVFVTLLQNENTYFMEK